MHGTRRARPATGADPDAARMLGGDLDGLGTTSGRTEQYGAALTAALTPAELPTPLRDVVAASVADADVG